MLEEGLGVSRGSEGWSSSRTVHMLPAWVLLLLGTAKSWSGRDLDWWFC